MIARVITIATLPQSITAARACIDSAEPFGLKVEPHFAQTPDDDPREQFRLLGWPTEAFERNPYSRPLPCMAAFLSHSQLWAMAVLDREPVLILEHDALMVAPLPDLSRCTHLCNLGRPSFGKWQTPKDGLGPLTSKPFLPGAHAYLVTPKGAIELLSRARIDAQPTDVYLARSRFGWIQELYPWPFECRETFSTIQALPGCAAKHRPVMIV